MPYQLVCEGACNPHIRQADEDVKRERRTYAANGYMEPLPEPILAGLHRLRHTRHERDAGRYDYKCATCGSVRRFGSENG